MNEHLKKALITLIAVLGYGGWAYYSNLSPQGTADSQMIALRAGIIQGGYSGILTLVNVIVLEALFLRLNARLSCRVNMFVTVLSAALVQYAIIIPVHIMNQTPNIFITLLPGFIIGTGFSIGYLTSVKNKHYPAG